MPQEFHKIMEEFHHEDGEFRKALEAEEQALKHLKKAEAALAENTAQWRDYLLLAKVKSESPSSEMGES